MPLLQPAGAASVAASLVDLLLWRRWRCSESTTVGVAALATVGSLVLICSYREFVDAARWYLGHDGKMAPAGPLRRRLKVVILGGGIGGTAVALWLRDALGDAHDLDLAVISDGPIGGRLQTVEVQGQRYEAGAPVVPGMALYFRALMRRFALPRRAFPGAHLPAGIFDGSDFLLCGFSAAAAGGFHAAARLLTVCRLMWRFGLRPCLHLWRLRGGLPALDWRCLRRALYDGATFAHPRELLSTLGYESLRLAERSTEQWLLREAGMPAELLREVVEPSLRSGFGGQGCRDLHALVGLLGLSSGGLRSDTFAVRGGNEQVPKHAFKAAQPRHLCGSARVVRRIVASHAYEPTFEVGYDASAKGEAMKGLGPPSPSSASSRPSGGGSTSEVEGLLVEAFHIVVVAHPLERSMLRFEACCGDLANIGDARVTTATGGGGQVPVLSPTVNPLATGSFQRVVAHFVYGTLDLRRFSRDAVEAEAEGAHDAAAVRLARRRLRGSSREADGRLVEVPIYFPAQVWTTEGAATPFYSIGLEFPVDLANATAARELMESAGRGDAQVYRVLAPRPLTDSEIDTWFVRRGSEPVRIVDWYAFPQYAVPQAFRPFVLDGAGVYYINAIEQVSSSVEMSLISARNVVNLVLDWVVRSRCF